MDGVTIGILTILTILIVFRCVIIPISEVIRYNDYKKRHDEYVKQKEKKDIPNIDAVRRTCETVTSSPALFAYLECLTCPYKKECDEYIVATGLLPNGSRVITYNDEEEDNGNCS